MRTYVRVLRVSQSRTRKRIVYVKSRKQFPAKVCFRLAGVNDANPGLVAWVRTPKLFQIRRHCLPALCHLFTQSGLQCFNLDSMR